MVVMGQTTLRGKLGGFGAEGSRAVYPMSRQGRYPPVRACFCKTITFTFVKAFDVIQGMAYVGWHESMDKSHLFLRHMATPDTGVKMALGWGEPNPGAVLRAAMAVTVFGPGEDERGDVENKQRHTDTAVSTTQNIPEFQGGHAGSCGRLRDGGR